MYFCSKSTKDFALLKSRFPPKLCLYHSLTSQFSKIAIPPILKTRYFKRPFYSFQAEACSKTFDQIFVSELPRFCSERGRKLPSRPFSFEHRSSCDPRSSVPSAYLSVTKRSIKFFSGLIDEETVKIAFS